MMVRLVEALPAGRWLYELKYGGYQALAFKAGKQVTLLSRNRTIFNDDSRQLIDGLKLLRSKNFVIDGEIAALDPLEVLLPAPSIVSGRYPQGDRSWRPIPAIHASLVRNRPAIGAFGVLGSFSPLLARGHRGVGTAKRSFVHSLFSTLVFDAESGERMLSPNEERLADWRPVDFEFCPPIQPATAVRRVSNATISYCILFKVQKAARRIKHE
jgi:ATP dependent DNA ligase domain